MQKVHFLKIVKLIQIFCASLCVCILPNLADALLHKNDMNPASFKDNEVCGFAVELNSSPSRWVTSGKWLPFVAEAKKRGLDCFVQERKWTKSKVQKTSPIIKFAFYKLDKSARKDAQIRLQKKSFYKGLIDGLYGTATEGALLQYNESDLNLDLTLDKNAEWLLERLLKKTVAICDSQNTRTCSNTQICYRSTGTKSQFKVWVKNVYFTEAKRRGLSCGVRKGDIKCSSLNLNLCSSKILCQRATRSYGNNKVWLDTPVYKKYAIEAKRRNLSCGVDNNQNTVTPCSALVTAYQNSIASNANVYLTEVLKSKLKDANCAFKEQTVGTPPQKTCDEDPAYCGAVQLCQKASITKNGKKVWRLGKAFETYIKAAESVGLSCNVEQVDEEEEIFRVASGTGFFVSDAGHVVTNEHVIDGCTETRVHFKGEMVPAKVIADDSRNDLALLKIKEKPSAFLKLSGENPYLLQDIIAAGYPFGNKISSSIKVTRGVVSSLSGVADNISEIQIDAALQPGNSGGPLLDENGNVVGVAVAKLDAEFALEKFGTLPENTNFGIKVSVVKSLLDAHEVEYQIGRSTTMPKSKLGKLANDGTVFLSCWMTTAQYEFMKTKKAMFDSVD